VKFEYLQVYKVAIGYTAFDGNSECDGDNDLVRLLNKLGQDRWEYCQFIDNPPYHLLKRRLP